MKINLIITNNVMRNQTLGVRDVSRDRKVKHLSLLMLDMPSFHLSCQVVQTVCQLGEEGISLLNAVLSVSNQVTK
jgi:hypothetical protein